jgi:hypothetical protein
MTSDERTPSIRNFQRAFNKVPAVARRGKARAFRVTKAELRKLVRRVKTPASCIPELHLTYPVFHSLREEMPQASPTEVLAALNDWANETGQRAEGLRRSISSYGHIRIIYAQTLQTLKDGGNPWDDEEEGDLEPEVGGDDDNGDATEEEDDD